MAAGRKKLYLGVSADQRTPLQLRITHSVEYSKCSQESMLSFDDHGGELDMTLIVPHRALSLLSQSRRSKCLRWTRLPSKVRLQGVAMAHEAERYAVSLSAIIRVSFPVSVCSQTLIFSLPSVHKVTSGLRSATRWLLAGWPAG